MRKIGKWIVAAVMYLCVATIASQAIAAGWLVWKKGLDEDKLFRILAIVQGVDLEGIREEVKKEHAPESKEQAAFEQVVEARVSRSLDLDLRESAMDKALNDLRALEEKLKTERSRYDQLRNQFDARLAELERGYTDTAIREVQRTLEAMKPQQAKDQILMMLEEDEATGADLAMMDVVTILKSMPVDKRKKIIGEFKNEDEPDKLHEILRRIRLGEPDVTLIRSTREKLNKGA